MRERFEHTLELFSKCCLMFEKEMVGCWEPSAFMECRNDVRVDNFGCPGAVLIGKDVCHLVVL